MNKCGRKIGFSTADVLDSFATPQQIGIILGIFKGTLALCRFRIVGLKNLDLNKINKNLQRFQSSSLKLSGSPKELNAGWVLPSGIYDEEEKRLGDYWDLSDCEVDEGYFLRLRLERRKVPVELFQIIYKQELDKKIKKTGKTPLRQEQKQLREDIKEDLLSQALPSISYIDAYWRNDGLVTMYSTAKKNVEIFMDYFSKAFTKPLGGHLLPISPPLLALSAREWKDAQKALSFVADMERILPLAPPNSLS